MMIPSIYRFPKKTKTNPELVFVHIKKNKNYYPWLVFLFLFVVGWLPLWGGRDDAGPCTRFLRRLRWDCDNWTRCKIFASEDCRNPSRVWRRDRRRLVWRPCIYKKLDVSSEKTVILPWVTHVSWGNFSFWHRLWLYDADVSDPSWNSMTLMPCFSIVRQACRNRRHCFCLLFQKNFKMNITRNKFFNVYHWVRLYERRLRFFLLSSGNVWLSTILLRV